jgi:bifunctional ADP-heptose synthase (sugar kinase/adenylyltransferase)
VDTRSKIVSAAGAPVGAVLVVGCFDVLGLEQVRALAKIRGRTSARVIAVVLPGGDGRPDEVLEQGARAEMAAALRMLDYVLIAAEPGCPGDLQDLVTRLRPAEIIHLDEAEQHRMRRLFARVQSGQIL